MIVETAQGAFSFADDDPTPVPGQNWIVDGVDFGRVIRIILPTAHEYTTSYLTSGEQW